MSKTCLKKQKPSRMKRISKISLVIIIFSTFFIFLSAFFIVFPKPYRSAFDNAAKTFGVDENLLYAIAKTESGFDARAVSVKGATGIMQIMPATAAFTLGLLDKTEKIDLFNPFDNVYCGAAYFAYLTDKYENENVAVAAYNAGEGNVDKWLADETVFRNGKFINVPFAETDKYLKKVKKFKQLYMILYKPFS